MTAPDALLPVLDAYEQTLRSVLEVVTDLPEADWHRRSRCPGWDVHDQVAHVVGVEAHLAGDELPPEAPAAAHVKNRFGAQMERAVHARRDATPAELCAELTDVIARRHQQLRGEQLRAEDEMIGVMGRPIAVGQMLPIRVYDVWAHEQDIRAAVDRPGNRTGPAADVSWQQMPYGMADALVTAAESTPGTSVRFTVTGDRSDAVILVVDDDGAATVTADVAEPSTEITLDWADLVARICGRDGALDTPVAITGDRALGERILADLAMTP